MDKACINCKFYEKINHRGQKYEKGFCHKHFASRLSDGYQMRFTMPLPREYVCELHEFAPQPIYALVEKSLVLIPKAIADDLIAQGWVAFEEQEKDKYVIKKGDDEKVQS